MDSKDSAENWSTVSCETFSRIIDRYRSLSAGRGVSSEDISAEFQPLVFYRDACLIRLIDYRSRPARKKYFLDQHGYLLELRRNPEQLKEINALSSPDLDENTVKEYMRYALTIFNLFGKSALLVESASDVNTARALSQDECEAVTSAIHIIRVIEFQSAKNCYRLSAVVDQSGLLYEWIVDVSVSGNIELFEERRVLENIPVRVIRSR